MYEFFINVRNEKFFINCISKFVVPNLNVRAAADADKKPETFRRGLLSRCEKVQKTNDCCLLVILSSLLLLFIIILHQEFNTRVEPTTFQHLPPDERLEAEFKAKLRVVGLMQFIGELANRALLPEKVFF